MAYTHPTTAKARPRAVTKITPQAPDRDPLDRIEDAMINVEGSTLLLDMVVLHGQHFPSDRARQRATFHANRLLAADVAELRRVFEAACSEVKV